LLRLLGEMERRTYWPFSTKREISGIASSLAIDLGIASDEPGCAACQQQENESGRNDDGGLPDDMVRWSGWYSTRN